MDQLWAPWRLAYVAAAKKPAEGEECFLCRGLKESDDRSNLIVQRRKQTLVVINRFPYNNGHLLIAPNAHKADISELNAEEWMESMEVMQQMVRALTETMKPEGFNIGVNLGKVAGAGLPGHLHWHIVPRWNGDTNFMPVLSDVRVIVQSLDALYDLLANYLAAQ